jgi:hypothetical protein
LDYGDKTIYGMEVHVRNAILILKKETMIDYELLSVSDYQDKNCSMNKKYLENIDGKEKLEAFPKK